MQAGMKGLTSDILKAVELGSEIQVPHSVLVA